MSQSQLIDNALNANLNIDRLLADKKEEAKPEEKSTAVQPA